MNSDKKKSILEKLLLGAVIGAAVGSVVGASIKPKDETENKKVSFFKRFFSIFRKK